MPFANSDALLRGLRRTSIAVTVFLPATLTACSKTNPGPLVGTWRADGIIPYTVHFRAGEEEALNIIRTVSYETKGRDVMVTYADGLSKGLTIRYTKLSPNVARASIVTFRRVGP